MWLLAVKHPTRLWMAEDPDAAEAEAYQNRAYPAPYVPQQLTVNAQKGWASIRARGVGKGKNLPGAWTLAGPSTANFPNILTFEWCILHDFGSHYGARDFPKLQHQRLPDVMQLPVAASGAPTTHCPATGQAGRLFQTTSPPPTR